jgi:hypothetical protein
VGRHKRRKPLARPGVDGRITIKWIFKHIMIRGGDWPPAHDELLTTYLNAFTSFIKSIDFQTLQ